MSFFRLMPKRYCIGLIVTSICKLMRIGRWSEPRFVFLCQLVEVIREAYATEISGKLGLALSSNLVGESQLRIPKLESDTILSNISLLCPAAKVMEALLLPTVNNHLLPSADQHGLRHGHSTTSVLLQLTSDIATCFNQSKPPHRKSVSL